MPTNKQDESFAIEGAELQVISEAIQTVIDDDFLVFKGRCKGDTMLIQEIVAKLGLSVPDPRFAIPNVELMHPIGRAVFGEKTWRAIQQIWFLDFHPVDEDDFAALEEVFTVAQPFGWADGAANAREALLNWLQRMNARGA